MSREKNIRIDFRDRRWTVLFILCGIAIILFVLLLIRLPLQQREMDMGDEEKMRLLLKPEKRYDMSLPEARRSYPMGSLILELSSEQILLRDFQGKIVYADRSDLIRPAALDCGRTMLVGDRESGRLILLSSQGKIFDAQIEGSFAGGDYNGRSSAAVILEVPEKNSQVLLLDLKGTPLFTLEFAESGNPIRVSFTPDGQALDILILNTNGNELKTYIKRYDLKGVQLAQKQIEDYPDLFTGLLHDLQGNLILYSPTHVLKLALDQELPLISEEFSAIAGVFPHGNSLSVVAASHQDGSYTIYELNENENAQESGIRIGASPILHPYGAGFAAASGNRLSVYDPRSGKLIREGLLDGEILRIDDEGDFLNILTEQGAEWLRP